MADEYVSFIIAHGVQKRRVRPFPTPMSGTPEDGLAPCLLRRGQAVVDPAQSKPERRETMALLQRGLWLSRQESQDVISKSRMNKGSLN